MYNVYSLSEVRAVLYHPNVGTCNLHQCGRGRMTVSYSGDLSSHTTTADGYVVVNRMKAENGLVTLEIPQNSIGDAFLRKWARYLRNLNDSARFAVSTLTISDQGGGFTLVCEGVTPQKVPDRTFDHTSTNFTWTFLAASITEQ